MAGRRGLISPSAEVHQSYRCRLWSFLSGCWQRVMNPGDGEQALETQKRKSVQVPKCPGRKEEKAPEKKKKR